MNNLRWMYLLTKEPLKKIFPIAYYCKNGYYIFLVLRDKYRLPKNELLYNNVDEAFEKLLITE